MKSYEHIGGERALTGDTIDQRFRRVVERQSDATALVCRMRPRSLRLTYSELDTRVQALAKGLIADGFNAGDRIGVWSTNNADWVALQLATSRVGVVLVNINPAYRENELEYALNRVEVQGLFHIASFKTSDYTAMVAAVAPRVPSLRKIFPMETLDALIERGSRVSDSEVDTRAAALDCDDPINIQFTSGTTGFPKPVVLTHHNILNNALFASEIMELGPGTALAVPVPFYHCFGMVLSTLVCIASGATLVIPSEYFDPDATLDAVAEEGCHALHGVPTMFVAMLEAQRARPRDTSTLRTGIMAGAPCPPEVVRAVQTELGCHDILIGYGQTEASPLTHCTRPGDSLERRTETVGTNLPHQEVKIVHTETGATVPLGEPGEVCFRGYHVMRGYYGDAGATAKAIDESGWLHSGDLGVMDGDGYVRITGRLKDMIIRGGENIYPAEIEAFYYTHPDIAEIAVFGVSDTKWGEQVAAWVRPHAGKQLDVEALRDFAKGKIAHYKIPTYIWIVSEFPMTVTGKIQKFRMREASEELLAKQDVGYA